MGLPSNPIGAVLSGKLSVAQTALPPNPLKGLVSPGVTGVPDPTPAPSHTLPPGGLEQLQAATEKASAPAVADFNKKAGTHYTDVPIGWKPEDLKQIHDLARHNPDVAQFWGSLVNPIEWAKQGVEGVKQAAHGADELAHGKLAHGALDVGLGGLSAAAILPMGRGAKALEEAATAAREAGAVEHTAGAEGHSLIARPKWLGGGLPHRTQEGAAAHLASLLEQAKAEGWGGHVGSEGHPPVVGRGVATPETGGDLGRQVREALAGGETKRTVKAKIEHPTYPEGTLFHGSPDGEIANVDALHHTKAWREGPGFYLTSDAAKAAKYADGKTASAERATGDGAINAFRLKPGAQVLNMDTQPEGFWREIASKLIGEPVDEKRWSEWASDIPAGKASEGVTNRVRLLHFLTGYAEMPKTDAYYAIEEALHERGVQATLHHENGIPVHVVKDESILERVPTREPVHTPGYESTTHLPSAAEIRDLQKPNMSLERTQRAHAAETAAKNAGGGTAGLHAALSELEGRFGRSSFPHLQHLAPEQLDTLHRVVDEAPLQTYERITANKALSNAVEDGVAPTEGEQALLERVFGKVAAEDVPAEKPSLKERASGILNVPRAIRSSADLSGSFRQNLITLVTHPTVFAKSLTKSARMFVDPAYHRAVMDEIHSDPYYPYLQKISNGKLFTEIGDTAQEGARTLKREEAFEGGNVAERLNLRELPGPLKGKKYATGPGDVVRASDRSFTGGLNYSRFMVGKQLVEKAALMGHDLSDPKVGESIADVLGVITGRGKVPRWVEPHLVTANLALFSPRLIAARLNLLSPVFYKQLDPFARGEALAAARNMVAAMGTVMVAAKMAGASVNFDPRSSNFGKIKLGNTRIDVTGGFSQYIRFIAQEMTRESISSVGHKSHIGWGQHDISDVANLTKFGRSKAAPIPGLLWDEGTGKDFIGRQVKQGHELWSNAPFLAQDIVDTTQTGAPPSRVAAAAFLSAIGFGVQSYKDKTQGRPTPTGEGAGLPPMPALPALPSLPALPEKP